MSDKSIDKLNEQINKFSEDKYVENSFDDVKLKVIKDGKEKDKDIYKTMKLDKIEDVSDDKVEKEDVEITRKIKFGDTKEISKKQIESLNKKIDEMKEEEESFDTTTGIFSNEVDEPLIKKAVLFGIGIFTILIILIIIVIVL